ncbi:MAG: NAD(P)-binding domain-containing protein [Pirellulales bacterium]|nr:NAD(P)-binding domain-containing protein [Pirellulales bacterium]
MPSQPPSAAHAQKFCILGAGSSGLAAAKNFRAAGIPFDCLERQDDIGGNWYFGSPASRVYASTHLVSSKRLTEYSDFPMPKQWAEYPSHRQTLQYLRDYATRFGLYEHIDFNTAVEWVAPAPPLAPPRSTGEGDKRGWLVRLAGGEERIYRGVVIANGHNWDPRWPEYPGEFAGEAMHSAQYKTADVLRGKRVLVIGGGNSGCDIACEAAVHAERALLSTRRAYHILPKFFRGKPIDECNELLLWLRLPLWARRVAGTVVNHLVLGPAWRTGVPRADHKLFESHPILNSQLHHHVGHGRLQLRPDVKEFAGTRVRFVDGREDEIDLILYATGYHVSFPFIDREHLNYVDGSPRLFMNVFHPERDDLFCIGLIQPDSGQFGIVDDQARLVARFVRSLSGKPRRAAWFGELKSGAAPELNGGVRYISTPRHALEVEHYSYRRRLRKLSAKLG